MKPLSATAVCIQSLLGDWGVVMRATAAVAITCLSLVSITSGKNAVAAIRQPTNIAPQQLAPALTVLAKDRDVQLVYRSDLVKDERTNGAAGDLTFDEALTRLLNGTRLTYRYLEDNAITIIPIAAAAGSFSEDLGPEASAAGTGGREKPFWPELRFAQNNSPAFQRSPSAVGGMGGDSSHAADRDETVALQEVVVTAEKRKEPLLKAPIPVTALQTSTLERQHAVRLADYAPMVPGLNLTSDKAGQNQIILRGITTGSVNSSTVSTYIDDSPFGSSTAQAIGGWIAPDLDPASLQRVEILRGPQGTLYGASSLGGLIKYVTMPPSLQEFSGRVETDGSLVDGGGSGYGVRAMIDGPLIRERLGFTLSAFSRHDPGYIDDPQLRQTSVNAARVSGGRAALLWKPTEAASVRLSALIHDSSTDGSSDEDVNADLTPIVGPLQQKRFLDERLQIQDRLYSATVNDDLGWASLTSITSYQTLRNALLVDETSYFGDALGAAFGVADLGLGSPALLRENKVTEELRIASPVAERLEWQGGFFFTHESSDRVITLNPFHISTGQPALPGIALFDVAMNSRYTEYAGFGDLTYHFTPAFDVLAGVRYGTNDQSFLEPSSGVLAGGTSINNGVSSDESVTYLLAPRYQLGPDAMVYARVASGYRPGGPNTVTAAQAALGVPRTFKPDTLTNYEVGYKASLLRQRMTLQLSVFDIEWRDIQIAEVFSGVSTIGNGAAARSAGLEAAVTWAPIRGLNLSANVAYTDAHLTTDAPGIKGKAGDRLPYVPRFSMNATGDYDFPISSSLSGFVGATFRHQGDRRTNFASSAPAAYERPTLRAYDTVDLRAGISRGGCDLQFYVKNVANSHALTMLSSLALNGYSAPFAASVFQPRTLGISLSERF